MSHVSHVTHSHSPVPVVPRPPRSPPCSSLIASAARVYVVGTVDHVSAPLIFDQRQRMLGNWVRAFPPSPPPPASRDFVLARARGVRVCVSVNRILCVLPRARVCCCVWPGAHVQLWHDATTFLPYVNEGRYVEVDARARVDLQSSGIGHVLSSLTPNHRAILKALADVQLEQLDALADNDASASDADGGGGDGGDGGGDDDGDGDGTGGGSSSGLRRTLRGAGRGRGGRGRGRGGGGGPGGWPGRRGGECGGPGVCEAAGDVPGKAACQHRQRTAHGAGRAEGVCPLDPVYWLLWVHFFSLCPCCHERPW
jgi:hypothetical protein